MTQEIEGESLIGVWTIEIPEPPGNLMYTLQAKGGDYYIEGRFRWYKDDKLFEESDDERRPFRYESKGVTEDQAIAQARALHKRFSGAAGTTGWELLRGKRTMREFMKALGEMPGIHMRELH